MTLIRVLQLAGVGLLVMAANIAATVLYMVVYGYVIDPGHPKEFYDAHVQRSAPYCSIVAGMPLMFLAGLWVAGWGDGGSAVKYAFVVWLAYASIDLAVLLAAGMTARIALIFAVSMGTKLLAVWLGAVTGARAA